MYCIYKITLWILLSWLFFYYCYFNDMFYNHFVASLEYWINEWINQINREISKILLWFTALVYIVVTLYIYIHIYIYRHTHHKTSVLQIMWPLLTRPSLPWTLLTLSSHCKHLPVFGNIYFEVLKWVFYGINRPLLKITNWSLFTRTSQCPQKLLFVSTLTSETGFLENDCTFSSVKDLYAVYKKY